MSKLYVTTAIPYVNGAPHLGHAMDYLLADIFTRFQTLNGHSVRLQAGTDEHGNKISQKAAAASLDPQTFADQNSARFRELIEALDVHYTDFIRTTDEDHVRRVQAIWDRLSPHIYQHTYEGWYCEGCENFITDKEYTENSGVCPDHQTPYQKLSEMNYYLRIADFKDRIKSAIENDELLILPEFRKKEILHLLVDTPDVSISRPVEHLSWGVPVPGDETQNMYVWMDALSNYLTVLGYPDTDPPEDWPAALQIVGKDILRFHAIIWPAMLLGLGLPLPRVLLSHGHVLTDGQKMSKSLGNVVDPFTVIERHGLDAFRYFFSRHIDTFADSDFTWEKYDAAYAGELANDLGNLVQRLSVLCAKKSVPGLSSPANTPSTDPAASTTSLSAPLTFDAEYVALMDNFEFTRAIDYAWGLLQNLNRRIDDAKPWAEKDPAAARELLQSLAADLLHANHHLKPFLPITAEIESIFTSAEIVPPAAPLFPKD